MIPDYTMNRVTLNDHLAAETLGDRAPIQVDPLTHAEQLLEERRFEKVMRMTACSFGKLSQVEKRNYTRWAKHLARVFSEKAAVFERNSKPEPEVPEFLQA